MKKTITLFALALSTISFAQTRSENNSVATEVEATTLTAAPTIYTTEAAFKAAIKNDYSLNEFSGCVNGTYYPSIVQNTGTYKYTITEVASTPQLYGLTGAFATSFNKDSILITNNGESVHAFGGFFYNTNTSGSFITGNIRVTVGTYSYVITAATTTKFVGFVFPEAITSVYIGYPTVQSSTPYRYASMDHLYWGSIPSTVLTISNNVAGNLATALGTDLTSCKTLTVTGNIDARDFKTMRDAMTALTTIDLSGATIVQYTGTEGTGGLTSMSYPANELPKSAFNSKTTLISLACPSSINAVGDYAFYDCNNLTSVNIPASVNSLKAFAFSGCSSLTSITIPKLATALESTPFYKCSALITVDVNNANYSSIDGVLYNKLQTQLIQCPTSKTGAFSIPGSVVSIGALAFGYCSGLTSIKVVSALPSNITLGMTVFENVNKTSCTLYVPSGSQTAYKAASQWKDFTNIVESIPTSINHAEAKEVLVYPNPTSNFINISSAVDIQSINITNLAGSVVWSGSAPLLPINVSSFAKGIYLVNMFSTHGLKTEKVIIK